MTTFRLIYYYPFRTLFACLLDVSQAFGGYGVSSVMTISVFKLVDMPDSDIALFYFVGALATIPGTLFTSLIIEKVDRKILLPTNYFICAVATFGLYLAAISGEQRNLWYAYSFYQFGYTLAWNISYPMYSEIFPTQYRSTGIGLAVAVGRTGGFAAPILLEYVFSLNGGNNILGTVLTVCSFFIATCIASIPWYFYGIEGRGKALEDCIEAQPRSF